MALSGAPFSWEQRAESSRASAPRSDVIIATRHVIATFMAALVVLATVGFVFATAAKPAGASSTFASGQVFASVGNANVNVYDPVSGTLQQTLTDNSGTTYTTGSAFDANGNLYVTDDDAGSISEYSPDGSLIGTFASGLSNPLSIVFDSAGNMYVGQQLTNYIAEFSPSGQRLPDIGPVTTELYGVDWIDLSSDQCTFYYTTERSDIMTYNKCTNTQGPNFNVQPLAGSNAFELKILDNGDVLVADTSADYLLHPNGNVIQTYACSSLPGCTDPGEQLFAISVDPSGTSFWTGDSTSGNIWQIDLATGAVMQTIPTHLGYLYGLSVDNQLEVATSPTTVAATPTALAVQPVSGNFSSPTPVSAVLTDSSTNTPIPNEQVTFTLNGTETCTATTDSSGLATCVITPGEPSQSYTLTASFSGDSSQSTPIGSDSTSSSFTVSPDSSSATYTGPATAVNGQSVTLTGVLTTDTPSSGTPLPTKVVTFTIGSGPSAQTCSNTTDVNGNASCTISSVDQPVSNASVTESFAGDVYNTAASTSTSLTVTEPTTLTVHTATGDFADATTVTGVLTDTNSNAPVPGEPVTLTLDGHETCTATTDATGTASCTVTPGEPAATYALTGTFAGDSNLPLQLMASNGTSSFVVTPEQTWLTYTGSTIAHNGQPLAVSGVLTTDDPAQGAPIAGRTVTFRLGSGQTAQTCTATTDSTGTASCSIVSVSQSPGPIPVTDTFLGDQYYQTASASSTVNLPEGTQVSVTPTTGTYNGSTTVSATLDNTYTGQPVPGEPVTLAVNGTQTCGGTTNAAGVATCPITPNEPAGTYSLTASFPGDSSAAPQLLSSSVSSTFTVTPAPTTFTYTGTTSVTNGQPATLSGVVTTNEPTPGTAMSGTPVTYTIGSGTSLQSCTATTNASGAASCTIASVSQTSGTVGVSAGYGGNTYYQSSMAASTAIVHTPTRLTVSAGTSDFADPGTVSAVLTNAMTGAPIAGEPVTLTLNGAQSCTATTNASGAASCSITPNEAAATYALSATFGGDASRAPQLLSSTGTNNYVVTLEETAVTYTGPSLAVSGMPFTMSGNLTTDGVPLSGRPLLMTLGSGSTAQSCTGTTNGAGNASCTIGDVSGDSDGGCHQTAGSAPVSVTFAGDTFYRPAGASGTVTTAAPPSGGGGFVVGDVSAGAPTTGTTVNFWGSQLWKKNVFSGVDNAPASMKGYIDNAPSYSCGAAWTSDPGNSSNPPSTIPVNMVVVVASAINQSGSTESGNIKHLVVVHVSPGYGPSPGHDGYGQIIATIC